MRSIAKRNAYALGKETLLLQTQEECGELVKAIGKYNRSRGIGQKTEVSEEDAYKDLVRELADVEICIEQLEFIMGIDTSECKNAAYRKVTRRYFGEDHEGEADDMA